MTAPLHRRSGPGRCHNCGEPSWIDVLRADPMVLWSVAGAAQKAVDHLVEFSAEVRSAA